MSEKYMPVIEGKLRKHILTVPTEIYKCSGIQIFGKRIKSVVFSTDVSIIRNTNADAIIAVYPFTPQPVITRAIMIAAEVPVFCGVGGGTTTGDRVVGLAIEAEQQGAIGVVLNAPTENATIEKVAKQLDIPIVITVVSNVDSLKDSIKDRLSAGASIFNVSAAQNTPAIVKQIREMYPKVPIMATGGPTPQSMVATVEAGANTITWTPPTNGEIFSDLMNKYRNK